MGYTPLVRWRNFTLDNLKTILEVYPDMTKVLPRSAAIDMVEEKLSGYKRTAYQFACQLGLECRGANFKVQNYLYTFDDENLKRYLNFWFKMYVTPNPYVNSNEEPISIYIKLAEEILSSEDYRISFADFCSKYFGDGKSSDILRNAIHAYGNPMVVSNDSIYLLKENIEELKTIMSKINSTFPMENNLDEEEFFNRFSYEEFCKFYNIPYLEDTTDFTNDDEYLDSDLEANRIVGGANILLYGVPGSGKSWTIENEYCREDSKIERLVFHPDYTNTDFIGQILPVVDPVDKQVTYEFTPGPFTNILHEAYRNPQQSYALIIEEINRGNAPAIFGDVFQLLDRLVTEKTEGKITFPVGTSEYGITNENIAKVVYGNSKRKVRIPSNLSILGTMNTSDQNVFTLDTAFQRRWRMRLIENNFDNVRSSLADAEILDTKVTWKTFCETINTIIIGNKAKLASAEDKRLGVYFIHENDLKFDERALPKNGYATLLIEYNELMKKERLETFSDGEKERLDEIREALIQNRVFPEKVIKYLWDDAFKFNPEALFDTTDMDNLEKVIRTFVYNTGEERFKIFKQNVRSALIPS